MHFIDKPQSSLRGWTTHFAQSGLPVLAATADAIAVLAEDQEAVAPRDLSAIVVKDPLMSLKVLEWAGRRYASRGHASRSSLASEMETVEAGIVMNGVLPFFSAFSSLETVEARLAGKPEALAGLKGVLDRAVRAADFAYDWAVHREDLDINVIVEAALLHDVAEMLTWVFAPRLSLQMQAMRREFPSMRSHKIQAHVLGITFADLEVALMDEWHLPGFLRQLTDDHHLNSPQVRNVVLAANLARHLANGEDDPALPDDYSDIAALLNVTPVWVRDRVLGAPAAA
jgi:HD-like signal output (HDOD) protein